MSADPSQRLDQLAEEFVARRRAGSHPTIAQYADRHPELADDIRELFPVLTAVEDAGDERATLAPDVMLGDYRLVREIGRGGMGVVYEALQTNLGRRVALKVLPTSATLDPRYLERFRTEARAAGRLQHRNIVPVIGAGEHEGVHYYTMQYIEGFGLDVLVRTMRALVRGGAPADGPADPTESLARRLLLADLDGAQGSSGDGSDATHDAHVFVAPGARPAVDRRWFHNAARLVLQAAEGVAAAHAQGVLHRDVKPSNLLVDARCNVWITDFGLCKDEGSTELTQSGDLLGTLAYMPPERIEGESTAGGDVYGLGITLYELLTLRPAYSARDRISLMREIAGRPPRRPRSVDPRIPRDLEVVCTKAIERDPERRYATAEGLAADLRAFLEGRQVTARAPSLAYALGVAVRRHKPLAITVALAATALVAGVFVYFSSIREERALARFQQYVANVAAVEAALSIGDVAAARQWLDTAPDEHKSWEWHHLESQLDRSLRRLWASPDSSSILDAAYSPRGDVLATSAGDSTFLVDAETGEERARLQHAGSVRGLSWSPDGGRLAVATGAALELWTADGERSWSQAGEFASAAFAPDGRSVCGGGRWGRLLVLDAQDGTERSSFEVGSRIHSVALDPAGERAVLSTWSGSVMVWELASGTLLWARRVSPFGTRSAVFLSPDLVACASELTYTPVLSAHTGEPVHNLAVRIRQTGGTTGVSVSPDGRMLLAVTHFGVTVWDTRDWDMLAWWRSPASVRAIAVHPSSTSFVVGTDTGEVHEWLLDPLGDPDALRGHIDDVGALAHAPSGELLASAGVGGVVRLWDLRTGEQTRTWIGHRWSVGTVAISPDERLVAAGDRMGEILLWDVLDDAVVHRLEHGGGAVNGVAFTRDGRLASVGEDGRLRLWDPASGEPLGAVGSPGLGLLALAVHPTGRWLAAAGSDGSIRLYDPDDLSPGPVLTGHEAPVHDLEFDREGERLASVSSDQTLRLWDVATLRELRVARAQTETADRFALLDVAFHPGGQRIATGGRDGKVRLWDAGSGRCVATLGDHHSWVHEVAFSPDGARLISSSGAADIRIWDTRPIAARFERYHADARLRREAVALVERRIEEGRTPDEVIGALELERSLGPELREAALRAAHRARGSEDGLVEYVWRTVLPTGGDPREYWVARGLASDLVRAAGHRNRQDSRRETLWSLSTLRTGAHELAVERARAASRLNVHRPELLAVDLSVLTLGQAALGDTEGAAATLSAVQSLVREHPELASSPRAGALVDEAYGALRSGDQ